MRHRIVITGGAGFLGTTIADRLAARGEDVLLLDMLGRSGAAENRDWLMARHPARIGLLEADIRDPVAVNEALRVASAVLHLAGQVAVTTSLAEPAHDFSVNAQGTFNLLEAFRLSGRLVPFLFASTGKVYGSLEQAGGFVQAGNRMVPIDARLLNGVNELQPLDFLTPHGCSKGAADQYVHDYGRVFGMPTAVLRMSCIYGPHQFGTEDQGWISHFLARARAGRAITVYGDGMQVRDVLHADDAADAWLAVLDGIREVQGRVFNLGGGPENSISLNEALALIGDMFGRMPEVRFGPMRPGDQPWYVSDCRALMQATGWRARIGIASGLANLKSWLDARVLPAPTPHA